MQTPAATDIRPFVPCRDFALSKAFYAAIGWQVHDVAPDLALVRVADAQHFYLQDYYVKDFAENFMLHITVGDAAAWSAKVGEVVKDPALSSARVSKPCRQDYGATTTFVHDPSGVLLHLCEWDRVAPSGGA